MRKCTRASLVQQQRVVVEPYLLGVDPGGRPLEGRGEGRQAGRHWVDRAGVQAAGLFCVLVCGSVAEDGKSFVGWSDL